MDTAVLPPSPPIILNFDSSCTTPYMSAPSSPPKFGTPFFSAPTSPTRISSCSTTISSSLTAVPFNDADFAFHFSGELDKHYLPADELFDCGKFKPFKPQSYLNYESSPRSPRSPRKSFKQAFSPRSSKRRDFDPLEEKSFKNISMEESQKDTNFQHGIERKNSNFNSFNTPSSSPRHNKTRSLSPFRVSDLLFDQETEQQQKTDNKTSNSLSSWYRKWKLKDLLLFRSASEGRPSSKAQLKKYSILKKNSTGNYNINQHDDEDLRNSSFRSINSNVGSSSSSVISSSRRRSGPISAHELHYTINRAVSEEMKKKTFLPYKQGLLGCLGFQQAAGTDISRGVGSVNRGSF